MISRLSAQTAQNTLNTLVKRFAYNGQIQGQPKPPRTVSKAAGLFLTLSRMIERKDTVGTEQLLATLEHDPQLSKTDRYDLLVQARCLTYNAEAIKSTLEEMHENGVKPGRMALSALIQYHIHSGDLEGAERLCLSLPKYGESSLDPYMTCTMIAGWGKHGQVDRAESLYQQCPELHNSCFLVTAMMGVYYQAKQYQKAIDMFDSLTAVKPDYVMRKLRSRCLHQMGNHSAAIVEWRKIQDHLHVHHWSDMARIFLDANPDAVVTMAKDIVRRFGAEKGVVDFELMAIRRACKSAHDITSIFEAVSKIDTLPPALLEAAVSRLDSFPDIGPFLRQQFTKYEPLLSPISRLSIQSKLC